MLDLWLLLIESLSSLSHPSNALTIYSAHFVHHAFQRRFLENSVKSAPNILHVECAYTREPAFVCRLGNHSGQCAQPMNEKLRATILAFMVVVIGIAETHTQRQRQRPIIVVFNKIHSAAT